MTVYEAKGWFSPGIGFKRWLALIVVGIGALATGLASLLVQWQTDLDFWLTRGYVAPLGILAGAFVVWWAGRSLLYVLVAGRNQHVSIQDMVTERMRQRGPRVVAVGGGTGLPSALRALKPHTTNIIAVVTVADDGGSSGRLRREMGVLPPGDLRNNIVALADDESMMAKVFQFRFQEGDLKGHSFGNLFISAMASITEGGLEAALVETARVLNIQGQVLPSTLQNVDLRAQVRMPGKNRPVTIFGEAAIGDAGGKIEHLELVPEDVPGYRGSVEAILQAEFIVLGPGSLYTSIIPNLLVPDIASALRATPAYIVYICNVAQQPGETDDYTVAEHIMAIENLIGRGVFQAVLANDTYPTPPPDTNTVYVQKAPEHHLVNQRYEIFYTDLTDDERPWRHDPAKLSRSLMALYEAEKLGKSKKDILA